MQRLFLSVHAIIDGYGTGQEAQKDCCDAQGGKLTIGTVILALTIGHFVSWIGKGLKRIL